MTRWFLGSLAAAMALVMPAVGGSNAFAADACPNAAYRNGAGANLPDCRAWEQATPQDKGGNGPYTTFPALVNPSGDQMVFFAVGDTAKGDGVAFRSMNSSVRRGSAWTTFGLDAPIDSVGNFITGKPVLGVSDDRSKALVVSLRKLTPDAKEGDSNLYVRNALDRSVTLAATVPGETLYSYLADFSGLSAFYGGNADFSQVAFAAAIPLTPDAPSGGGLYVVGGGQIHWVSRDAADNPLNAGSPQFPSSGRNLLSNDGRRVTFAATGSNGLPGLFQRVDDSSTVLISHSRRAQDDQTAVTQVVGEAWGSTDGTRFTFQSGSQLTDDGPGIFYRWNANGSDGTITDLLNGVSVPWSNLASGFGLSNVSPDGRYLWFTYTDQENGNQVNKLAVLDASAKTITVKATFDGANATSALGPYNSLFSPDGTKMIGSTGANLTNYDQSGPACTANGATACSEAFYFDAKDPAGTPPVCMSCGPAGTRSVGNARIGYIGGDNTPLPTLVSNDGRAFFDTPQPLSSADANTLPDVYEFTPGRGTALISSGTGSNQATVESSTPSGNDVLFFTADPLVPQDNDTEVDVYDARAGGGLAAQQVRSPLPDPCSASSCPGPRIAVPGANSPGTSIFRGAPRPPVFRVGRVSASARRSAASSGRLRVSVRVGAAGRVSARAIARLRGRRSSTIGRSSSTVRKAGRLTLTLDLSRAARGVLEHDGKLPVALTVSYSRASKSLSQSFLLTEPRTRSSAKGGAR